MLDRETLLGFWEMCVGCSAAVHGHNPPTTAYADRAARLLFGTLMVESGGAARRQHGFDAAPLSYKGAFGAWQCELGSIRCSLMWLDRHHEVRGRAEHWLELQDVDVRLHVGDEKVLAGMVQDEECDALSCVLARFHYFQKPEPIPNALEGHAGYWLKLYNGYGAMKKWTRDGVSQDEAKRLAVKQYERAFLKGWVGKGEISF